MLRAIFISICSLAFATGADAADTVVSRSARSRPAWLATTPVPDATFVYAVGFVSGFENRAQAREQAIHKAMGKIAGIFGQTIESRFFSREVETEAGHRYHASLELTAEAQKLTLRGVALEATYHEERATSLGRRFDFYALVRYPKAEFKIEQARLKIEATREEARLKAAVASEAVRRTIAVSIVCFDDETDWSCPEIDAGLIEISSSVGFRAQRLTPADDERTRIAAGDSGAIAAVAKRLDVRYLLTGAVRARPAGDAAGIVHARARGAFSIIDASSGKIIVAVELGEEKAGHLDRQRATHKVVALLKKKLTGRARPALRKLYAAAPGTISPAAAP